MKSKQYTIIKQYRLLHIYELSRLKPPSSLISSRIFFSSFFHIFFFFLVFLYFQTAQNGNQNFSFTMNKKVSLNNCDIFNNQYQFKHQQHIITQSQLLNQQLSNGYLLHYYNDINNDKLHTYFSNDDWDYRRKLITMNQCLENLDRLFRLGTLQAVG